MKLLHNKFIAKALAVIFGLATAGYFAWTFSFFGAWLGDHFPEMAHASQLLGYLCAAIMFLGVLYVFFYIEYVLEDVQAYEYDRGDGSFIKAFKRLKFGLVALEFGSLLFRLVQLGFSLYGVAMVVIGLALLYLSHLLGKVLHAQMNRPYEVEADRIMNEAGNLVIDKSRKHIRGLGINGLRSVAGGDFSPLDSVHDVKEQERLDTEQEKAQKRQAWIDRKQKAQQAMSKFLAPRQDDPTPVLDPPGSNGHSKQPSNFH